MELELPPGVRSLYEAPPAGWEAVTYRPDFPGSNPMSVTAALLALRASHHPFPANLLPLGPVDDRSIAAVLCQHASFETSHGVGYVVRWHLDAIPMEHQAAVLDVDARLYVESVLAEAQARKKGLEGIRRLTARYRGRFLPENNRGEISASRPKAYEARPIQLACQNVIVGLAAFAYRSEYDALDVLYWQTCEAPHLATGESSRALAAIALCEAFATGSTMELRFTKHPERGIPATLERYARVCGLEVGGEDRAVVTPEEARELFLAVTPMTDGLRQRTYRLFLNGNLTPERLCYMLLAGIWTDVELDFMLGSSWRATSILSGGAHPADRLSRSVETEVCRSALMVGMLQRRLDLRDERAASDGSSAGTPVAVRSLEDDKRGVGWGVNEQVGSVTFSGYSGPVPWSSGRDLHLNQGELVVLPRPHPTYDDLGLAQKLQEERKGLVVLLTPFDRHDFIGQDVPILRCPDKVSELDASIEARLLSARVSRS
jgi:hypothetical protein